MEKPGDEVTQELRSPLNGMVGLTTALCKSPALSAPMKKQLFGSSFLNDHVCVNFFNMF